MALVNRALHFAGWSGLLLIPGSAMAQDGLQLDLAGGGSASRNPFLQPGDDTAAAAAYIQADPRFRVSDEISTLVLEATVRVDQYIDRYDASTYASGGLTVTRQISPATSLRARALARTSQNSASDFFPLNGVVTSTTPTPSVLPDVSFAGTRTRSNSFEAAVGLDQKLSESEGLTIDLTSAATKYSRFGQSNYRFVTASTDYNRRLSETTWASFSLQVGASDYIGRRAGDGVIITPTAGLKTQLNSRLSLDAKAGVSLTRVTIFGGGHSSKFAPALQAKLCDRASGGETCAFVSHQTQTTALSGLAGVTNGGFMIFRRLNVRDQFDANVNVTLTGRATRSSFAQSGPDLVRAGANLTRNFNIRFAAFVSPSYARLFDVGAARRADVAIRVGLRYRLGAIG